MTPDPTLLDRLDALEQEGTPWIDGLVVEPSVVIPRNHLRALIDATNALILVRDWIRDGSGSEAEAVEAMDAALAPLLSPTDEKDTRPTGSMGGLLHQEQADRLRRAREKVVRLTPPVKSDDE